MQDRLDWDKLKEERCPKCGEDLKQVSAQSGLKCSNIMDECDFRIGAVALEKVLRDLDKDSYEGYGHE